jgi:pimeloyl-ACP methyl ester carboxylesterase
MARGFITAVSGPTVIVFYALILGALLSGCSGGPSREIDEQVLIDTGDTRLFAEIRGDVQGAPILLYLHGGPASPLGVPIFRAYGGRLLEEQFVLVYLHQRGIMKSPRVADEAHTVDLYVEDIHHVVQHLRRTFPKRRIFLLGHSWGGVLALLYLADHPSAVEKLVAVSTPVVVESMLRERLEMTLRWAEETGNSEAITDLSPLKGKAPADHPGEFEILGKWTSRAYGGWARNLSRERINAAIDYEESLSEWLGEQKYVEELLRDELLKIDLSQDLRKIDVPLLCIVGRQDVDVPWHLVQMEFERYSGPMEFEVFEDSHHMPFIDEEAHFVETVAGFLTSNRPGE